MIKPLRVAMIGHAFMGRAHSHAWRSAHRFFDLLRIRCTAVRLARLH
jgi:predicted dehydrogenase